MHLKIGLTTSTYDVIAHNHSNRFSSNLCQLLKTAGVDDNVSS